MEGVIKTDQIQCYDVDGGLMDCSGSGQDGEMRFGLEWPIPRFEEREGVAIDRLSGLMWIKDAGLTEFPQTWREALDFVEKMNREAVCGYHDWHLPERWELNSLVSHNCINPSLPIDAPFKNVFAGYYWTATTYSRFKNQAWYIHLGGGRIYRGMKYGSYMVWPVRFHLPDHARASTAERFVVDKDIVYDQLTGLEWAKMDALSSDTIDWKGALDFVRCMNAASLYGHVDWRLPNVRELESLVDVSRHTPALSHGYPFGQIPQGCWSSTTSIYEPRYAWVVYMQDGAVGVGYKKNSDFHVWAVRSGIS